MQGTGLRTRGVAPEPTFHAYLRALSLLSRLCPYTLVPPVPPPPAADAPPRPGPSSGMAPAHA